MRISANKIYQSMPDCIEVFSGKFGLSVRSSRRIAKGTVIDPSVEFAFIDNSDSDYALYLNGSDIPLYFHSYTNTLFYTEVERVCNGYIGYLNHSCTNSNVRFETSHKFGFAVIASRDIEAHEELTSNYLLFDYSCDGHAFECTCGAAGCYGAITGFRDVPPAAQLRLVDDITDNVLHQHIFDSYKENPKMECYVKADFEASFSHFSGPRRVLEMSPLGPEIELKLGLISGTAAAGSVPLPLLLAFTLLCDKACASSSGGRGLYLLTIGSETEIGSVSRSLVCNPPSAAREELTVGACAEYLQAQLTVAHVPVRVVKHALGIDRGAETSYALRWADTAVAESESPVVVEAGREGWSRPEVEMLLGNSLQPRWLVGAAHSDQEIVALDAAFRVALRHILDGSGCGAATTAAAWGSLPVSCVPLLDETARREVTVGRNDTLRSLDRRFVFESLEEHARSNPDKVALESHRSRLSYRETVELVTKLACVLQALGAVPEAIVGVMMPRDCAMVAALFGVLKSGAAYAALLCDYPEARLRYILDADCKARLVVTVSALEHKFSGWFAGKLVFMDRLEDYPQVQWTNRLTHSNLAYITYTSGSTGAPKGIQVEHLHLIQYTQQETYHFPVERYLHSTSITFDIVALEIYVPLVRNKSVFVVENLLVPDIPKVGFIQGPSSLLEATPLAPGGVDGSMYVSQVGEKLTSRVLNKFGRIYNGYGTAETVNISVCKTVTPQDDIRVVGRPQTFTWLYILSSDLTVLPDNVTGEIYIGGPCIARGYLNLPELTASKFIANPFADGRLYKTGDLGLWTTGGELMLVGRADSQIKRNGVRIELGELEVVATRCPGVIKAVATFSCGRLYLYWTGPGVESDADAEVGLGSGSDALLAHLRSSLPAAMIPNELVHLPEIPLGPNGKVNRMGLPRPPAAGHTGATDVAFPVSELEKRMYDVWCKVLRVSGFELGSTFFQVGGDSLRLVQLLYAVKAEFGVALRASDVYSHDSVPALVAFMDAHLRVKATGQEEEQEEKGCVSARPAVVEVSYYQMHQILWFNIQMSVRITFPGLQRVDLTRACSLLERRFPILKARLRRPLRALQSQDRQVKDLGQVSLYEMEGAAAYRVETLADGDDGRISRTVDMYQQLSRCCISGDCADDACLVLHLSHLIFDGYSIDRLFRFLDDTLMSESEPEIEPEDFGAVQQSINSCIRTSYDRDWAHWRRLLGGFSVAGTGTIRRPMDPLFDKALLKDLSPFEMIHLVSSKLPFRALFHIETAPLRTDSMNLFQNGCLLVVERNVSVADIEDQFRINVGFSSIPIFLLINALNLRNMVYINHATMRYDGYRGIAVELLGMEEGDEDCAGHYPVSIVYNGPEDISLGMNSTFYYCDTAE